MVHVYHGPGKGKTCAAMGQAMRASGAGWRVACVQFLKDGSSSEVGLLAGLPGVAAVLSDGPLAKFTFQMSEQEKAASRKLHDANLARALGLVGCAGGAGESGARSGPATGSADRGPAGQASGAVSGRAPSSDRGPAALLVLDEALDALRAGLLDEGLIRRALAWAAGRQACELVVTGHWLPDFVEEAADYLTRLDCERHPYQRGVGAREGVEY